MVHKLYKNHLHRGIKSCQLKFDRIKRESPYREMLQGACVELHEGSGQEGENAEHGSRVDEDNEDGRYDGTAESTAETDISQIGA